MVKMCEDPAAVIQDGMRPGPSKCLLTGSLLADSGALKGFSALTSIWEYWIFYEKHFKNVLGFFVAVGGRSCH